LGDLEDIADYVNKGLNASESDMEDNEEGKITLPSQLSSTSSTRKGPTRLRHAPKMATNPSTQQSAIRLHELGPRFKIELIKIEEGLCTGDVIFHAFVHKTKAEKKH